MGDDALTREERGLREDRTALSRPPPRRGLPVGLLGALLVVLAGGGAAAAWVLWPRAPERGRIRVASEPPGALVFVDGASRPLVAGEGDGVLVEGLGAGEHHLTLRLPDHRPATVRVFLDPADEASWTQQRVRTTLLPEGDATPAAPREPAEPDAGILSPAESDARVYTFDPRRIVVAVPRTAAVHRSLDPRQQYDLGVDGEASIDRNTGKAYPLRACWFYARGRGGVLGGPLTPRVDLPLLGIADLWLFVPDYDPSDNTGILQVRLKDAAGRVQTVPVSAKRNAVKLDDGNSLRIRASSFPTRMRVKVDGLFSLGPGGVPIFGYMSDPRFVGAYSHDADKAAGFAYLGDTVLPRVGFDDLRVFLLDDDPADNSGEVRAQLMPDRK